MKSDGSEQRKVMEIIRRYMISRPDVGFKINRDGKIIGSYKPTANLLERLTDIWGGQVSSKLLRIEGEQVGPLRVRGYTSTPEIVRGNRGEIYCFVNDRPVLEKAMFGAISSAYANYVPPGRYPYVALFLDIEPNFVDINVHPAKTEVRFSDEGFIFSTIRKALEKTLAIPVGIPMRTQERGGSASAPVGYERPVGNLFSGAFERGVIHGSTNSNTQADVAAAVADIAVAREVLCFQVSNTYIILKKDDELLILDQHTAHERILFEKTLRSLDGVNAPSQKLLFEERVKLTPEESQLADEIADMLTGSGFEVRRFGPDEIIVSGMPQELSGSAPGEAVKSVLSNYLRHKKDGLETLKAFAASVACRGAVMAGDRLSEQQMQGLYRELMKCNEPYRCPHGRPTMAVLRRDDLERIFKRK